MKNLIKYIFVVSVLTALLMLSCETYIDIEVPPIEQKPVLNCLFTENEPFKVRLSLSMDVNDTLETVIEGAQISLFANDEFIEELADSGKGFYISNYQAKVNIAYRIKANIEGYETLIATDSLPQKIIPENVYYKKNAIFDNGNYYTEANLSIYDPSGEKNYYEILLSCSYQNQWYDPDLDSYTVLIKDNIAYWLIDDPIINAENVIGWIGSIAFSDELFNGKEYQLQLPIDNMPEKAVHIVTFNTTSYHYYKYKSTMDKHLFNQGGFLYDELFLIDGGNPVEMYSNVKNGYGIFAGYISQVINVTDIRE